MKKLHVIAMADRREELLKGLLHLGCVEISEPGEVLADPQWASLFQRSGSSLAERKGQLTDVNTALDAIKQYAKLKDGMFIKRHPITEAEFLDAGAAEKAQAACDAVREQLGILTKAQSEAGRLESRAAALKPWESLDLPLERSGTAHTIFRLGVCPGQTDVGAIRVQMEAEGLAAELYEISADKLQKYLLVIVHRGDEEKTPELLRPFGFSAVTFQGMTGTAAENIRSLERELEANKKTQDDAAAAIAASAENRDALRIYADRLRAEAAKEQCAESVLTDETVLYFQGWVPAEQEKAVGAFLTEKGCAWEALDPTEEEIPDVPVQLKNNWLTKPLNMVTEMYSLPRYDNVDPNPLMAPFFILFYGIMMTDMGYGTGLHPNAPYVAVKVPVFSFEKLHAVDTQFGPEMKSTGEVLGIAPNYHDALLKGLIGAGYTFKTPGPGSCCIFTVKDSDKPEFVDIAWKLKDMGYKLYGTSGTCAWLNKHMVPCNEVRNISGEAPNIVDLLQSGLVDYVFSTSAKGRDPRRDSVRLRRKAVELSIPCITAVDTAASLVDCLRSEHSLANIPLVDIATLYRGK